MQWVLDHIQTIGFIISAVACISVEWRRPGFVMAGFALLCLMLEPYNDAMRAAQPSLFMLMYAGLDMLAAAIVFDNCKPSRANKSYRRFHWLGISGLMLTASAASLLNFSYTMGYTIAFSASIYDRVSVTVATLLLVLVVFGSFGGVYEMVKEKLARAYLSGHRHRSQRLQQRSGIEGSGGSVLAGPGPAGYILGRSLSQKGKKQ